MSLIKTTKIGYSRALLFVAFSFLTFVAGTMNVSAAPDLLTENLTGSGVFTPGSMVTFSGTVRNIGGMMDTSNSYGLVGISKENTSVGYPVKDMVKSGNYLYIVSNRSDTALDNFEVYSIADPTNPVKVFGTRTPNTESYNPYMIEIKDNYVYIGQISYSKNILVYDITNPVLPVLKTTKTTSSPNVDTMHIQGDYLYIGSNNTTVSGSNTQNLDIFSISNRTNPNKVKTLSHPAGVSALYASGNYLYVVLSNTNTGYSKLWVYNIINPSSASKVSELAIAGITSTGWINNIVADNGYVYLGLQGNPYELVIIDATNPPLPMVVNNYDFASALFSTVYSGGRGMSLNYPYLYIGNFGSPGISVIDIASPGNPKMLWHMYSNSVTDKNLYDQTYVYGAGLMGIQVLEPHAFARFCVSSGAYSDANRDLCLSSIGTTTRIGGKDFDAGRLNSSATYATSTVWTTGTAGTYTAYFCSDVRQRYGFDGAAESNESNNCSSATFIVATPGPDLVSENLTLSSGPYTKGNPITLTAQVRNAGTVATSIGFSDNFTYQWNGTGGAWQSFTGNTISKGILTAGTLSADGPVTFTPAQTGNLYVQHCVDSTNIINEGVNETPNCTVVGPFGVVAPTCTGVVPAHATACSTADPSVSTPYSLLNDCSGWGGLTKCYYECSPGYVQNSGMCVPTQCNDGIDNVDPEDTIVDLADTGCVNIDDNDETNLGPELTATEYMVAIGQSTTLMWDTNNGDETLCALTGGSLNMNPLPAEGDSEMGTRSVVIEGRVVYTLTCPSGVDSISIDAFPRAWEM